MRGSVEWAPKSDDTDLDHPIFIIVLVFCFVVLAIVAFLMKSSTKKYNFALNITNRSLPIQNQPVGPFADTQGIARF